MDRAFNFLDHPSLLRQSQNANVANNPPSSSPSLLAHPGFVHGQPPVSQQSQPQRQQPRHSTGHSPEPHAHGQHHHPQRHQQLAFPQPSRYQQSPTRLSEQSSHQKPRQQHHSLSLHVQTQQQQEQRQYHHSSSQQQHAHVHLQPMETNHQDTTGGGVPGIHSSSSPQTHFRNQSRQQQAPSLQNHPHQFQIRQLQQHHAQAVQDQHTPSPSSHQHHQVTGLHVGHTSSQVRSLGLRANNNSGPNPSPLTSSASQFGHALSRECQSHPQALQLQVYSQANISGTGTVQSSLNSINPYGGTQNIQMHSILSSHQPAQTSFGSLNIPGAMLSGTVVDDPAGSTHHFNTSHSGDGLSGPYPWDPPQNPNALASSSLSVTPNEQRPLVQVPVVGDVANRTGLCVTNGSSTAGVANPNSGGQEALNGGLATNMGELVPSLNTVVVSGANNGGTTGAKARHPVAVPGTERSQHQNPQSDMDGTTRTGKTMKKARSALPRKVGASRVRAVRAVRAGLPVTVPITSTESTNLPNQSLVASRNNSFAASTRSIRLARGGKPEGGGRGREEAAGRGRKSPAGMGIARAVPFVSKAVGEQREGGVVVMATAIPQTSPDLKRHGTSGTSSPWPVKIASSLKSRKRNPINGSRTATVPVHLRNPKKGRARVFRECKQCKSENHIRRSDCLQCKAPLPAGKRRRDGNPSYDRKRVASTTSPIPETSLVSQHLGSTSAALHEASVITK